MYMYAYNSPIKLYDYLGLMSKCERKIYQLDIDRLIAPYVNRESDCNGTEECTKISFFVEMGDPCDDWPFTKIGHTAVSIGDSFRDFGPSNGDDSPGQSWWGEFIIDSKMYDINDAKDVTHQNIIDRLKSKKSDSRVTDVTVMVQFCACKKRADQMQDYWNKIYDKIKNEEKIIWKIPGLHCTSSVCQSFDGKDLQEYMDPKSFLTGILKNLKHECGQSKGKEVRMEKVKSYNITPASKK